ncbi:MAG: sigma-70 family RNA polymerase sigma factor [Candidatus Binatia bacterium]
MRVGKIHDNDANPFASEIMTYLDHLYRVAYYLVKNTHEAQDCVQETCLRALGSRSQYEPGTNMKAWLTRILYNLFYDAYARKRQVVSVEDLGGVGDEKDDFWERLPTGNPGPESVVMEKELEAKIGAALRRIPEEFRAAIVLVDMGDFSYAEAGEILSCPIGTVRSRLSRGRKLLQKELSPYVGRTGTDR